MEEKLRQDIQLSYSLTSSIYAAANGSVLMQSVMEDLEHPLASAERLDIFKRLVAKSKTWVEQVLDGVPLISLSVDSIDSFDAQAAFDAADKVRDDLDQTGSLVTAVLAAGTLYTVLDDAQYALAAFGRFVFSRDAYMRSHIRFCEIMGLEGAAEETRIMLPGAVESVAQFKDLFELFQAQGQAIPQSALNDLFLLTKNIPPAFRTQAHELRMLHSTYQPEFTFDLAGIESTEAFRWQTLGIEAASAGYWRAQDIGPEEAIAWAQAGIADATSARLWRDNSFSPGDAATWFRNGFPPLLAERWKSAHFSATEALEALEKGFQDPALVKKNR